MNDPLKSKVDRLKVISDSAKRRAGLYCDIAKIDGKNTSQSLRALHKAPAPGQKLQKVGFILFWVPEPTGVTMAVGAPMMLAGRYLDRIYNGATISDIGHETKHAMSSISDFKQSLH